MSREIKFRGKDEEGKWHYGGYLKDEIEPRIAIPFEHGTRFKEVLPETVGQYIGKKDINGKEIYEGDINSKGYIILWNNEKSLFAEHFKMDKEYVIAGYPLYDVDRMEIKGNIHDNPELLKQ